MAMLGATKYHVLRADRIGSFAARCSADVGRWADDAVPAHQVPPHLRCHSAACAKAWPAHLQVVV